MSLHVVVPTVLVHALPFAPEPLARQANSPEALFGAQVCRAAHVKGVEAHPDVASSDDDEHATIDEIPAAKTNRSEVNERILGP